MTQAWENGGNRAELLMRQAPMTAETYLSEAVTAIDAEFGEGYSRSHPELVGAFIQACASDYAACFTADFLGRIATALNDIGEVVASVMREKANA